MKTSIAVPLWNEEHRVENAYNKLHEYIVNSDLDLQLVFVTNGCIDNTVKILNKIKEKDPSLIHLDYPDQIGKGKAIEKALENVQTPYVIFMDCDLATDLRHIPKFIDFLENGADLVIASRKLKESEATRSFKRRVFSNLYNLGVRILFRSKIKDHQCGFKGFRRESFISSLNDIESSGWFWDTELIVKAQRRDLNIIELPVHWKDLEEEWSRFNLWNDAKKMGFNLIKFRWNLFSPWVQQLIRFLFVGVSNTLIAIFILWLLDTTIGRGLWGYPFTYLVATTNSFLLNKIFTFKQKKFSKNTPLQYLLFLGLGIVSMTTYSLTAIILEIYFGFFYVYASLGGTAVHFMIQFIFFKFIVFKITRKNASS